MLNNSFIINLLEVKRIEHLLVVNLFIINPHLIQIRQLRPRLRQHPHPLRRNLISHQVKLPQHRQLPPIHSHTPNPLVRNLIMLQT